MKFYLQGGATGGRGRGEEEGRIRVFFTHVIDTGERFHEWEGHAVY